jgi:predicted Zn-dependent protease
MDDRLELLQLLDASRAGGARAAEVLHQRFDTRTFSAERSRGERKLESRWTLRLWLAGGQAGVASGPGREGLVARALADAACSAPSAHAGPADRLAPLTGSLGVDDRRHAAIAQEDRDEMLHTAVRALEGGGVHLHALRYDEAREQRSWISSREVERAAAATTYRLQADAELGGVRRNHRIASRHFSDVASLPFGLELRRRLERLASPAALPAGPLPLVLESRALAALVRDIAPLFAASAVAARNLLAGRLDRRLASTALHLTDDAGLPGGLRSLPFDDRGVPPIAVALLKEGVPGGLYHDPETARAAGLRPTGHAFDGALRPSNLIVRPGSRTRNVLIGALPDHLVADELPPLDLQTGRVRGPVALSVVTGGRTVGTATAGLDLPLDTLLGAIEELAADQERVEEVDAPTAVFAPLPWQR